MLKKTLLILGLALPLVFFVASCGDEDEPDTNTCDTSSITYTDDIATILNSSCAISGCHNAAAAYIGSLADYNSAVTFANSGRLAGAINHDMGFAPMPYPEGSAKLSDCNIDKIEAWIADGAPE